MRTAGVDVLLLSLGADLPWLSGYEAMPLERPTVLVFPADDRATLVVPELEAPRVAVDERLFALRPWTGRAGTRWRSPPNSSVGVAGSPSRTGPGRACSSPCSVSPAGHLVARVGRHRPRARRERRTARSPPSSRPARPRTGSRSALLAGEIALIGRTEAEVAGEISARLLAQGHAKVNFAIVGAGPNSASPHHAAGSRRIVAGDPVVCDFGGTFRLGGDVGYCSDVTRTIVTGEPSSEMRDLYDVVERAQAAAVAAVTPGLACGEVDRVGRRIIAGAGFGAAFIHRIGHGIGIEEHEDPYLVEGNEARLEVGHAFSVEPGIYLAGRFGTRIEDVVVVSGDGVLRCNAADRALHVVAV